MRGTVPVPGKGQPMKAAWGAAVADRVNSLCAMAPAGMLARDGVGGMGAQPLPANLRERRKDGGDGVDEDTKYGCDEFSVSDIAETSSSEGSILGNFFYLSGFGKFTVPGRLDPYGTYENASEMEIGEEATAVAFLVRTGNSSSADANFLAYRKIKIPGTAPTPFQYAKHTDTSGVTPVTTHKIVNCMFYWNGVLQTLQDFDCSSVLSGGSVYLRGTQAAPSSSSPDPAWTWTLGTSAESAPQGGKVLNYKLYDFANSKVSMDYRTTFLALEGRMHKTLVEGENITLTEDGDEITISAELEDGESTSGFTGSRNVLVDVKYDSFKLWKKFATETWEDGVLKSSVEGSWEEYHTAVEETVKW